MCGSGEKYLHLPNELTIYFYFFILLDSGTEFMG